MCEDCDFLYLIVEVSVTVYAFLLGLPTLVSQIFLPDDLRRMSRKNYYGNILRQLSVPTIVLCLIVWLAFPALELLPSFIGEKQAQMLFRDWLMLVLFFTLLAVTIRYVYKHLLRSQGYRAKIVEVIKKKTLKGFAVTGALNEDYMKDLADLGLSSKPGEETDIVIAALDEVLQKASQGRGGHPGSGSQMANIISILCDTVVKSPVPGSRQNMANVLAIYRGILMYPPAQVSPEDYRKIRNATAKIAHAALKEGYADLMPPALNVLTLIPYSSDKLFELGRAALERGQFQTAVNAFSEIMDRDNEDPNRLHNYLGLAAHLRAVGTAAREYVLHSLKIKDIALTADLIGQSRKYHFMLSNFATADHLEAMWSDFAAQR